MMPRLTTVVCVAVFLIGLSGCNSSADQSNSPPSGPGSGESKESQPQGDSTNAADNDVDRSGHAAANGTHYRINSGQSHFTALVAVGGLFSAFGHDHTIAIKDFGGDVQLTAGTLQPASFKMTIKANSLAEVGKEFNEKDRQEVNRAMHEQALETTKYSEIVFQSTNISVSKQAEGQYQAKITGNLTLHGVTHLVSFPAQVKLDGNSLHARGQFTVTHSAYNMKRISAGGGTVKAKDAIKLSFDIVSNKV